METPLELLNISVESRYFEKGGGLNKISFIHNYFSFNQFVNSDRAAFVLNCHAVYCATKRPLTKHCHFIFRNILYTTRIKII